MTQRVSCVAPDFSPMAFDGPDAVPVVSGKLLTVPGWAIRNFVAAVKGKLFEVWFGGAIFNHPTLGFIGPFRISGGHNGDGDPSVIACVFRTMRWFHLYPMMATRVKPDPNPANFDRAPLLPFPQAIHNYDGETAGIDPLTGNLSLHTLGTSYDSRLFDAMTGRTEMLPRIICPNGARPKRRAPARRRTTSGTGSGST